MRKLMCLAGFLAAVAFAGCGGTGEEEIGAEEDGVRTIWHTGSGAECYSNFDCGHYEICTGGGWGNCTREGCETRPGHCTSAFGDGGWGGGGGGGYWTGY